MFDFLDLVYVLDVIMRICIFLLKLVVYPIAWLLGQKPKWSTMFDLSFEFERKNEK